MKFGLRHIRYFVAVAEELHFRRAADRLYVSQPVLSRAIQHLESELGVILFERNNRSVRITEAGKVFFEGSRELLNSMDRVVENTQRTSAGEIGTLRIGYTDLAIDGALPELLAEFRQHHIDITLQPHHGVTHSQLKELEAGSLDIGFVTGPVNHPDMETCIVQTDSLICVVPESHRFAKRSSVALEDLANEPFVLGTAKDWQHFYSYLIPKCRQVGFTPKIAQEAFNTAGILGLVACGMGITILTEGILNNSNNRLVALPLENFNEKMITVAVWRTDINTAPKKLFVDFIRNHNKALEVKL